MPKRLAVATTFPVYPRLGGGQVRIYNLYRQLARRFDLDIEIVSLGAHSDLCRTLELAPGLRETTVPKSRAHDEAERLLEIECGHVVTDIAMAELYPLTPGYLDALRTAADGSLGVIASHPFTLDAIAAVSTSPLIYEAQDVEYTMKAELLRGARGAESLLATVERVERACCQQAAAIWVCSDEDRNELVRRYEADPARVEVVPNGADLDESRYIDGAQRRRLKEQLGLAKRLLTVFVASWHPPNIEAASAIFAVAERLSSVDFLVLGSVGLAFTDGRVPDNVQLAGPVSSQFKQDVFAVADAALNPITSGSGTNLKMLDYFASGVPVISTDFGARGLSVVPGRHYLQAEPDGFGYALDRLSALDPVDRDAMTATARAHVEAALSWEAIARDLRHTWQPGLVSDPANA